MQWCLGEQELSIIMQNYSDVINSKKTYILHVCIYIALPFDCNKKIGWRDSRANLHRYWVKGKRSFSIDDFRSTLQIAVFQVATFERRKWFVRLFSSGLESKVFKMASWASKDQLMMLRCDTMEGTIIYTAYTQFHQTLVTQGWANWI